MAKATIKEVAAAAGVSIATVSRVVNQTDFVSDEIKAKVLQAIKQTDYQPNRIARSLKMERTYSVGVVIPDISNPFYMSIARGIEDVVHEHGYQLMFFSSDENPEKERNQLQLLLERRTDAVVLATASGNEDLVEKLVGSGAKLVLIDREIEIDNLSLSLVAEHNEQAAYELTMRLLDLGHHKIGVLTGPSHVVTARDRYAGFLRAFQERGLSHEQDLLYNGHYTEQGGEEGTIRFIQMEPRPSAILSLNNRMTFGALQTLRKHNVALPEEMTVASFGEVEAVRLLDSIGMLYVHKSPREMGIQAGRILLSDLKGELPQPRKILLMPTIETY